MIYDFWNEGKTMIEPMIKMQPLNDYALLQKVIKERAPGTIITLKELDSEEPEYKVVSVGPGTKDMKPQVKHGDIVYISKYNIHNMKIDAQEFILVKFEYILGVKHAS